MDLKKQPWLGLAATVLVVAASLAFAVALTPAVEMGWATLILVAMVPTQILLTLFWHGEVPRSLGGLKQPGRGLAFIGLTVIVGLAVSVLSIVVLGGGEARPTPFVIMVLIITVPVTLWQAVLLDAWPWVLLTKSRVWQGVGIWVATYVVAWAISRIFYDFSFLRGAPFYREALDPHGLFYAQSPLTLCVGSVSATLALVVMDFWPTARLTRQPARGLANMLLVAALVGALWLGFVTYGGMDVVQFQARVCVCLIFGLFILLVTMRLSLFTGLAQPWRGLALNAVAAGLAVLTYALYAWVARTIGLASGGPGYSLELWLASAMLAITFPFMVVFADFLDFWPLVRR